MQLNCPVNWRRPPAFSLSSQSLTLSTLTTLTLTIWLHWHSPHHNNINYMINICHYTMDSWPSLEKTINQHYCKQQIAAIKKLLNVATLQLFSVFN